MPGVGGERRDEMEERGEEQEGMRLGEEIGWQ